MVLEQYVDESGTKKGRASLNNNFIFNTEPGSGSFEFTAEPSTRVAIFTSGVPENSNSPVKK